MNCSRLIPYLLWFRVPVFTKNPRPGARSDTLWYTLITVRFFWVFFLDTLWSLKVFFWFFFVIHFDHWKFFFGFFPWYTLITESFDWYTLIHFDTLWSLWYTLIHFDHEFFLFFFFFFVIHFDTLWYTLIPIILSNFDHNTEISSLV